MMRGYEPVMDEAGGQKVLQTNGNWYKAELNEVKGFVPKNYININLPSWYQVDASRSVATEMLTSQHVGAFLVRASQNRSAGDFSISVKYAADVKHLKVLQDSRGQYRIWSEMFPSLNQLVDYYTKNSISKQTQIFLQETQQQQQRGGSDDFPPLPCPVLTPQRPDYRPLPMPRKQTGGSDNSQPLCSSVLPPRHPNYRPIPAPRKNKTAFTPQVRALYSYKAKQAEELEFTAGDIIKVLECSHQTWWKGQLGDKTGLFPSSFTKPI
ncbi:hypothetical protein PAMA_016717 [Pampus argenteus]